MKVLIGKKIGMTQVYNKETGKATPVTVLDVSNNVVSKVFKNGESISHFEIGKDKVKKPNKADTGNYKTVSLVPKYKMVFKNKDNSQVEEAKELKADVFSENDLVDIIGTTKGKGFAGVMKRWGFKGGKATHGQSDRDRAPGAIGSRTIPGRVFKGKKMSGHMGNIRKTVKNLKVIDIDTENNLITVSGSVPGFNKSYLVIKETKR